MENCFCEPVSIFIDFESSEFEDEINLDRCEILHIFLVLSIAMVWVLNNIAIFLIFSTGILVYGRWKTICCEPVSFFIDFESGEFEDEINLDRCQILHIFLVLSIAMAWGFQNIAVCLIFSTRILVYGRWKTVCCEPVSIFIDFESSEFEDEINLDRCEILHIFLVLSIAMVWGFQNIAILLIFSTRILVYGRWNLFAVSLCRFSLILRAVSLRMK
jgi:hypothetical protein